MTKKLFAQEQICLEAADSIVTTCEVTKNYLIGRSIPEQKIVVIPNGVQLETFTFAQKFLAVHSRNSHSEVHLL
ncbi:glycosyltransferase, partial [Acinetobacter baumannii]